MYSKKIEPNLKEGVILAFAHGFNIHFGKIKPTDDISVVMIAPKGPGHTVRSTYMSGGGVPSLIAIYRDSISLSLVLKYKSWLHGIKIVFALIEFKEFLKS